MSAAQVEKFDLMTSSATFMMSVTSEKLGKDMWFTGGTLLNDCRLVMADHSNNQLVELDDQYNVVKEYKTDGSPTDVAAGNKDNEVYIAVTKNSVHKCTLDTKLTVTSRIKGPSDTRGIAVGDDSIIVSTPREVVVMTQDGVTKKTIPVQGGGAFVDFPVFYYVAVSRTQRTLYHRDGRTDVVCRTLDGTERFRYTHQQLDGPGGMCLDRDGNLYVCGLRSPNVHQISPVTQTGRVLVNTLRDMSSPWCVVYIPLRNELVVTSGYEYTVLEVYRLG